MTARKAFVELREFERFQLGDGVVVLPSTSATRFGRIKNISLGGLAVSHFDEEVWESSVVGSDMILAGYDFCLEELSAKIVSDVEVKIENPYQEMLERQCVMEFGDLTPEQYVGLREIIRKHATGKELFLHLPVD